MSNYQVSSQKYTLSAALRNNQRLKMRFKTALIIYTILACIATCCCLIFDEQPTVDLVNIDSNSRTSLISGDTDELVSSKLISSSNSSNDSAPNNKTESMQNIQSESSNNVANLTPPNNVIQDKLPASTNSSSFSSAVAEIASQASVSGDQLTTSESRESPDDDFNNNYNYNYNRNQDETQDGSDLNFSLMNAPHDKLQAVKHLLNTERSILASQGQQNDQSMAQGVSQQCTYKGKQYLNGQNVPIEEQPCLNCTCRRAILQCYLRVCPPIISLEAHKKMQVLSKRVSGENCQMVKEPHQCCPTLKCDPIATNEDLNRPAANSANFSSSPIQFVPTPPTANRFDSDSNTVSVGSDISSGNDETNGFGTRRLVTIRNEGVENGLVLRIQQQQHQPVGSATNRSVNDNHSPSVTIPTTPSLSSNDPLQQQEGNLPKLTVIKGTSGQPDSILLITSNPSTVNNIISHGNEKLSSYNSSSYNNNQHQIVDRSATASSYSDALLNALLETVYSSVAQLNGLNLQGSCMINGSLYVEGSAVMPEGNAYCQYCYCIRQKIMCVKPKCHLMISGCSPKYSNEYACCPTSYSCTNSDLSSTNNNNQVSPGFRGSSLISQSNSASKLAIASEPQNLSAKLSAAIDSISRMSPPRPERQANLGLVSNEAISARQVDGSLNPDSLQSTVLNLMNSIGLSTTTTNQSINERATPSLNETEFNHPLTFRTFASPESPGSSTGSPATTLASSTSTSTTTTTTTTTTSSTTTTTTPSPAKPTTVSSRPTEDKEEADSNEDDGNGSEEEEEGGSSEKQQVDRVAGNNKNKTVDHNQVEMDKKLKSTTTSSLANLSTNTTTEQPSSVSDFLEPMNKLGPLIMSLSTASSCNENGRQYAIGVQIPTLEACKHCYCGLEGVKECKKVECGLKTPQRNGCKPVTPEGHCCPIRYDCPPFIQLNHAQSAEPTFQLQHQQHNNNRYRFEESPFSQSDISQCNNDSGEACSNKFNTNSNFNNNYADQSGNSEIENIKGLSEITDPPPVVRTTRIVPTTPNWTPLPAIASNSSNNAAGLSGLTEELNKFIMQINQNTSSNQGTGYSLAPSTNSNGNLNANDTPASIVNTHEMMINDQHSKMVDYHSVQAPPSSDINGAVVGVPQPLRNLLKDDGRVLITNGEIVPAAVDMQRENLGNKLLASTVEYAINNVTNYGNNMEFNSPPNHQVGSVNSGSRDSRSTNAHKLNEIIITGNNGSNQVGPVGFIELANLSLPLNSSPSLGPSVTNQSETVLDDYLDGDNNNNNTGSSNRENEEPNVTNISNSLFRQDVSNMPHVRLMRNNHKLPPETNHFRHLIQNNPNTLPLVVFDDSISNNNNSNGSGISNQNNPNNVYNTTPETMNNQTQPRAFGRIELGKPIATSDGLNDDEENSTPTPPQPTTGTPLGLDADRGPETRGWLKSLSGLVHSFGRRLVPGTSNSPSELDGAASDGKDQENQAGQMPAIGTARSKQQSLFNHLIQMLSNGEQQQFSLESQEPSRSLVMRPLASVIQIEPNGGATLSSNQSSLVNNKPRAWPPVLTSPYEPVSSSEIEIVTAAVPSQFLDPDLPESTLTKVAEGQIENKDAFAKRSDIGQDIGPSTSSVSALDVSERSSTVSVAPAKMESKFLPSDSKDYPAVSDNSMTSSDRSLFNRANKQLLAGNRQANTNLPVKPQQKSLTCYDSVSNKTYQANENWVPSDDYCKTCTCILGEQRCQTLTCPEKPAENCKEERRSGDCCANYICGSNLGSQTNPSQISPLVATTATTVPMRGDAVGANARMMMPSPNNQQVAAPRATNSGQVGGAFAGNSMDFNQHRGGPATNLFPRPPAQVVGNLHNNMNNFPPMQQAIGSSSNNQALRNTANDANQNSNNNIGRQQQLPQHPFRVNELPNVLPPHLRFRPNFQANQLASNHLTDSNQNKVLFFNQALSSSDQRFPLQNFISRRNDNGNINLRIPLNDALNQIGQKASPVRSSSIVNPTVLLHPQKVATRSGGGSGGFNQPFNGQMIINNHKNNNHNHLQVTNGDNNWRSPMMNDNNINNLVNNVGNLPSNILIPRMSGDEHQRDPTTIADNNQAGGGPANWQPSSPMVPNNPNSQATLFQKQRPESEQHHQQQSSQTSTPRPTNDGIRAKDSVSANEVRDKDRIHFQAPSTMNQLFSENPLNAPPVDTGFRPIVPMLTSQRPSTLQTVEGTSTVRQNDFTDSSSSTTTRLPDIDNRQQLPVDIVNTVPIEVDLNKHAILSAQTTDRDETSTSSAEYSSLNSTPSTVATVTNSTVDDTSEKPKESDQAHPDSIVEMTPTTAASNYLSTTTATTSYSTTLANTESSKGKQETNESGPTSQSPQPTEMSSSDESPSFDFMSIRVSECNIYGKIYPVGQVIKELSDSCKRCTCTSQGVECESKC